MQRDLSAMERTLFDVLVIGGGINGTAAARDAARRGLVVGLVEKHDFGWGTTATSTRLIHGGLRYLENFDFSLVREGLREREALLRWAPHRVKPLPFVTPIYQKSRRGPLAIRVGMYLYDLLSYDKSLPAHRWLNASELLALEPHLNPEGLTGGALYYDAQVDLPERFCIDHARDAASSGARLANYAEVVDIQLDEPVHRVTVIDRLTGRRHVLQARLIINAGGPWADTVMPEGDGRAGRAGGDAMRRQVASRLRKTKGIHVVVDSFTRHAVVQLAERDGRVFFVVPWRGYALIGTTDTDYHGDPGEAHADAGDVTYLIEETRRYFPTVRLDPIYLTTAGVRPLVLRRPGESESKTSRRHEVIDSAPGKSWGIVSILGGKITNHRVVAAQAVDVACRKLNKGKSAGSTDGPLFGGDVDVQKDLQSWKKEYHTLPLSDATWEQLVFLYGSRTPDVLEICRREPELAQPISSGSEVIAAQLVYAVEQEMCQRTPDFMLRRSGMGLAPRGMGHADEVRRMLAERLSWDDDQLERDRDQTRREAAKIGVPKSLADSSDDPGEEAIS